MGYILVLILGGVAVVVLLMAIMGGRRRPAGKIHGGGDVTPKVPSAESPNPAASTGVRQDVADKAQRHTPPA